MPKTSFIRSPTSLSGWRAMWKPGSETRPGSFNSVLACPFSALSSLASRWQRRLVMSRAGAALDEASALKERGQNLWHVAEREMRDRPWRTSAMALGAGYLLGGGLFSPLTARLLALGVRVGLRVGVTPL